MKITSNQAHLKIPSPQHKFEPVQKSAKNDHSDKGAGFQSVREPVPTPGYTAGLKPSPAQAEAQEQERDKDSKAKTWQGFLNKIERTLPVMFALLSKGVVKETGQNKINVELKECTSFDNKRLKDKKNELQKSCKNFLGKELTITIVSKKNMSVQNDSKKKERQKKQATFNHPLVLEAKKIFNGDIINQ